MKLIDDILDSDGAKHKTAFYRHIELDSELEEIKALFEANDIVYEVSSADVILDKVIVGNGMFSKYTLKILPTDFKRADTIISQHNSQKDINVEDFPHLTELTNEELYNILEKPKEWSSEAEVVAKKILQSRGVSVTQEDINQIRDQKIAKIRAGKSVPLYIQLMYFLSIAAGFYFGMIFIIAGIGMGYYYAYGTSIDSHGEKYFVYDEKARQIGMYILYGGLICLVVHVIILYQVFS